jgi:anti-sigma B factor antagonist
VSVLGDVEEHSPLEMSLLVMPDGEVVVRLRGDLDICSAKQAFRYVGDTIDRCRGRVLVDLSGVDYCDAIGLRALALMCNYADHSGCALELAAPPDSLLKVMKITGLDFKSHMF